MRSGSHLGIGFKVWNGQQTWFWLVVDQYRDGATVGAAATEAEAIGEACSSIEEVSGQPQPRPAAVGITDGNGPMPAFHRSNSINSAMIGWLGPLVSLAHDVSRILDHLADFRVRSSRCFRC